MPVFDFKNPDYLPIYRERTERLAKLRAKPKGFAYLRVYYRAHPEAFINDWGLTVDPTVAAIGREPIMPFILQPKQLDLVAYIIDHWRTSQTGLIEKSREVGCSWLAMALSCTLCIFHSRMMIGFGSATEKKLDESGNPDTLFYKGRLFMEYLPPEFTGGWRASTNALHMRLLFERSSSITGEAGDKIGRGGRKAIYFVDEAAHLERPKVVDAGLTSTTKCRIDMSSVAGMANSFAQKRHSGKIKVFTYHWRDDLRKDEAWYKAECDRIVDPMIIAQELDLDYQAGVEGTVIPANLVLAAVDAHVKLGIKPSGEHAGSLDVADEGKDANAFSRKHGFLLLSGESWRGKGSDIFETVDRAFLLCDMYKLYGFKYDADGLGAGCRGDARVINERRKKDGLRELEVTAFRGSGAVLFPEQQMIVGRKNDDYFENLKAQSWWALRFRFIATFRALQGKPYNPDDIISIASDFKERAQLCTELSQPRWKTSKNGKIMIDKTPPGLASPNLADSVMMLFAPRKPAMIINPLALETVSYDTQSQDVPYT